jgi:hypothetical protein
VATPDGKVEANGASEDALSAIVAATRRIPHIAAKLAAEVEVDDGATGPPGTGQGGNSALREDEESAARAAVPPGVPTLASAIAQGALDAMSDDEDESDW